MATFSVCSASSLRPLRLRAFDRSSQSHRRAHRERPTSFMDQSQTQTLVRANGFRWMDFDAYLFDIDGTLLVTRDLVHYNALNRAIREVYESRLLSMASHITAKPIWGFFAPCSSV